LVGKIWLPTKTKFHIPFPRTKEPFLLGEGHKKSLSEKQMPSRKIVSLGDGTIEIDT
jgi:hypothetical protein